MKRALKIFSVLAVSIALASGALAAQIGSFSVKDADGKAVTEKTLKGKTSVLVLLQSACGQCRGEVAELKNKSKELSEKANVYYVLVDLNAEAALAAFKNNGLVGTVLSDPGFDIGGAADLSVTPATIVLDKDLNIVKTKTGYKNGDVARLIGEL